MASCAALKSGASCSFALSQYSSLQNRQQTAALSSFGRNQTQSSASGSRLGDRRHVLPGPMRSNTGGWQKGPRRGTTVCGIFGLGVPELVVIAGVAAVLFGPKQLPELGKSLGKTVKSFQQAAKEFEGEIKKSAEELKEEGQKGVDELKKETEKK